MNEPYDAELWQPCPPGEIARMVGRLESERSGRRTMRIAGALVLLLCAVGVTLLYLNGRAGADGSLACSEVQQLLPGYVAGELDDRLTSRVEAHLTHCAACREVYESLLPPNKVATSFNEAPHNDFAVQLRH